MSRPGATRGKTKCAGSRQAAVEVPGSIYPACPECGRQFGDQGRKAYARMARLGNPWLVIPDHFDGVKP